MFFKPRPISKLNMRPPSPQASRFGVAIVAIVKNEGRFIKEWALFHALAGVRHFYIYDNGSTDDTCEKLNLALPHEAVTIIPWDQSLTSGRGGSELHNQVLAFAHALANYGGAFRWMAFIDVDEFIVPKMHNSIDDALSEVSEAAHISLPWHMFGRSGHEATPAGGIVKNFLKRMKNRGRVTQVGIMQKEALFSPPYRIIVAIKIFFNSNPVKRTCSSNKTMNFIALLNQELS